MQVGFLRKAMGKDYICILHTTYGTYSGCIRRARGTSYCATSSGGPRWSPLLIPLAVQSLRRKNRGLHLLGHPASSPDFNLAEHPIRKIKYNLINRQERRPTKMRELRAATKWE